MGIPSYFAHIVRKHRNIIQPLSHVSVINNLYLDCNSFIYEAQMSKDIQTNNNNNLYETNLVNAVCDKLVLYIKQLKPNKRVFIAFDGVAPMAKLNQQRNRRYMSSFQSSLTKNTNIEPKWNTAAITPGTEFMENLGNTVKKRFCNPIEFGLEEIIVSTSNDSGEGEHKIYEYIRNNASYHKDTTTVIYGLDADLIMLTLNHLHISENMFLFRETPEFIKHIDKTLNPNEMYLLHIPLFAKIIINTMSKNDSTNETINLDDKVLMNDVLFDYIFICFFLGNDFLPHFPALNIRTTGIDRLIETYKFLFSGTNETLTKDRQIIWKNVRKFINDLSINELDYIHDEYKQRNRLAKYANNNNHNNNNHNNNFKKEEDENLMLPIKERSIEMYIDPTNNGWESRYYTSLFNIKINDERRREICTNYLEGLEWTMKYYSTGCANWRWVYNYYYPPLLIDLIKYVPMFDHEFIPQQQKNPVSQLTQLSYVLPPSSMHLLPIELKKKLNTDHPEWYVGNYNFLWSFCKFFWEAHVDLPHIDIDVLERTIKNVSKS